MENLQLVIFDMDGLIFDSERVFMEELKKVMADFGYRLTKDIYLKTIGLNGSVLKETMLKQYGADYPFELISKKARENVNEIADSGKLPVKKGIYELLLHISKRKIMCCVASSSPKESVERYLKKYGLFDFFCGITGGKDVEKSKPEPDIFLAACRKLNVKPECALVIEDSQNGLIAAQRAGIRVVCIPDMIVPREDVLKKTYFVAESAFDVCGLI